MSGRLWWADVVVSTALLRHATFDLDAYLLKMAPQDARPPSRIERLHVRPSRLEGAFLIRCLGREADA